jgi:cytochrome b
LNGSTPTKPIADDVRVWDLFVRLFHWSLVVTALTCLLTEDDSLGLHVVAGYAVGLLVAARIVWGFVGPPAARFANFAFRPSITAGYLGDLVRFRAQRYLGHSPAGGAMILLLIVTLIGLVGTGLAAYAAEEHAGPLAAVFADADRNTRSIIAVLHQGLGNLLWLLIFVHLAGIVLASIAHRENLVKAMITGRKRS